MPRLPRQNLAGVPQHVVERGNNCESITLTLLISYDLAIGDVYGGNIWDNFNTFQKYFIVQTYNGMGPSVKMSQEQIADYFNDGE